MSDEERRPLEEKARRKPTWKPGRPVVLADGHEWHIPRPVIVLAVDDTESGFTERLAGDDPGDRYLELARARRDATTLHEFITAEVLLGSYLLRWNYDLTPSEVAGLMPFLYDAPEDGDEDGQQGPAENGQAAIARIREDVMAVVRGLGPKPPPGGPGSPPTPPG